MKYFFFSFVLICSAMGALGQSGVRSAGVFFGKPVVDSNAIRNWVSLKGDPVISNDGSCVAYGLLNPAAGGRMLIVQSTGDSWKKELAGVKEGIFSEDSKEFVFLKKDTLYFLLLGTDHLNFVAGVGSWREVQRGKGEWVAWQLKDSARELVLHNLLSEEERRFSSVEDYGFDGSGQSLLLRIASKDDKGSVAGLQWVSLPEGHPVSIWLGRPGSAVSSYAMGDSGRQVVFGVRRKEGEQESNTLWYYKVGMDRAVEKVNNQTPGIETGLVVDDRSVSFSHDGRNIFFQLRGPDPVMMPVGAEGVDVWSYRDTLLQSVQMHRVAAKRYMATISTESVRVVRLENDYERLSAYPVKGDYVVVGYDVYSDDRFWLKNGDMHWLVSLRDGSRRMVLHANRNSEFSFSSGGRYLVYYRADNYYSYDLISGVERNISGAVPGGLLSWFYDEYGKADPDLIFPIGMGGWLKDDGGLLVYDDYDIWRLDPSGKRAAVNITNGYGRRHRIKFRLVDEQEGGTGKYISEEGAILLTAFNTQSKYNGFYRAPVGKSSDPELLTLGPWTLNHEGGGYFLPTLNPHEYDGSLRPVKAGGSDVWVVRRSTATEAPNYYITNDLKKYRPLTNLHPQTGYNWLTTELITYPQVDGTLSQGVLYKPEDFDPHKKYPLILLYYEQFSHRMYEYPEPDFSNGEINVAWFVSRGYLVFTPDIHYKPGWPGESTYNSVVGGAQYLSKRGYVDGKRIGINGHSWGGFETYYLVTHSRLFAAALAGGGGSGSGDWISASLALAKYGEERSMLEERELSMGATLWERPDRYLENSPVLRVDRVTTPLLMLHDKVDGNWPQAVEMFLALRRLNKRAWLLQYDHGEHVLYRKDREDYTIRVEEFFDHYLKGYSPARWLTQGIPARLKGLETGYEPDTSGRQP